MLCCCCSVLQLVEALNEDYSDYVGLSGQLSGLEGAVVRMRQPLLEIQVRAGMVLHNILSLKTAAWQCFNMLLGMHTIGFGSRGSRAGVMLFCRQGTDLICSRSAMLVYRLSTSSHILPCASCACCCILMLQAKLSSVQDSLKADLHSLEQVG